MAYDYSINPVAKAAYDDVSLRIAGVMWGGREPSAGCWWWTESAAGLLGSSTGSKGVPHCDY